MYQYVDQIAYDWQGIRETQFPNQLGYNGYSCFNFCKSKAMDDADFICAVNGLNASTGFTESAFFWDWTDTDYSGSAQGSERGMVDTSNDIQRACP